MDEITVYEKALALLARREHTEIELLRKLKARHAPPSLITKTLQRLKQEGFLSHARFAEAYVRMRYQAGFGPQRIALELHERGVEPHYQTSFLHSISPEEWKEKLTELCQKKFNGKTPANASEKAKQMRFFYGRGFTLDQIKQVIN